MILRLLGEDIRLETVRGTDLPPIVFDPGQMEQIIVNLVANARDAMPAGGRLTSLAELRPVPDILVTDVVMPGINGTVLAARVTAAVPGIRVLYVSGYTQNVIVNHGILKDDVEFLAKPYSVDQLARRVGEVLHAGQPDDRQGR